MVRRSIDHMGNPSNPNSEQQTGSAISFGPVSLSGQPGHGPPEFEWTEQVSQAGVGSHRLHL